jgi:hypothetical protein
VKTRFGRNQGFHQRKAIFYDPLAVESGDFQQLTSEILNELAVESWKSIFEAKDKNRSFLTGYEGVPAYQRNENCLQRIRHQRFEEIFVNHM